VGLAVAVSWPTLNGLLVNQLWTAMALFPSVVSLGLRLSGLMSHANGDAVVPTTSSQPGSAVKHQVCLVSVEE
jgi:hypothetical protein